MHLIPPQINKFNISYKNDIKKFADKWMELVESVENTPRHQVLSTRYITLQGKMGRWKVASGLGKGGQQGAAGIFDIGFLRKKWEYVLE